MPRSSITTDSADRARWSRRSSDRRSMQQPPTAPAIRQPRCFLPPTLARQRLLTLIPRSSSPKLMRNLQARLRRDFVQPEFLRRSVPKTLKSFDAPVLSRICRSISERVSETATRRFSGRSGAFRKRGPLMACPGKRLRFRESSRCDDNRGRGMPVCLRRHRFERPSYRIKHGTTVQGCLVGLEGPALESLDLM